MFLVRGCPAEIRQSAQALGMNQPMEQDIDPSNRSHTNTSSARKVVQGCCRKCSIGTFQVFWGIFWAWYYHLAGIKDIEYKR